MSSQLTAVLQELRSDLLSMKVLTALSAGVTGGLGLIATQVVFATFIFSGELAQFSSQGIGLILFGNFASCLIMALAGGYRGVIAGLSPALILAMSVFGTSMDITGEALFITVTVTLMLTAVITGISCFVIGQLKLAHLLRFIPYPVSAGFVAGIGGAVCIAAMSLMGADILSGELNRLLETPVMWIWITGVAYGVLLFTAVKLWRNPLILPVSVILVVCAYHLAIAILGISTTEAQEAGLLLTATSEGGLWPVLSFADFTLTDWGQITSQIPNMLVLILIALICVIMNIAGLEVATRQDLDWNGEFRASGTASTLAGLGGGTVATIVVPASPRSKLFHVDSRLTGIFAALILGAAVIWGGGLIEFVPPPLVGGILVFAGLGMLDEGLARTYPRLTRPEFGIIVLILVTVLVFGLLEGVVLGLLTTLVLLTMRLSRVNPIEESFTLREQQSSKTRPIPDRAILSVDSNRMQGYRLRGYIFFGSIAGLADNLNKSLNSDTRPDCLLLEFKNVPGVDFFAENMLLRILQTAHSHTVKVVLSSPPQSLKDSLERNLNSDELAKLVLEDNLDNALEICEDTVIASWEGTANISGVHRSSLLTESVENLERHLTKLAEFEDVMDAMADRLKRSTFKPGDTIADTSTKKTAWYFLISGRVAAYNVEGTRLYQCSAGETLWPTDTKTSVSALLAEEDCEVRVLDETTLQQLEDTNPELANQFYKLQATQWLLESDTAA